MPFSLSSGVVPFLFTDYSLTIRSQYLGIYVKETICCHLPPLISRSLFCAWLSPAARFINKLMAAPASCKFLDRVVKTTDVRRVVVFKHMAPSVRPNCVRTPHSEKQLRACALLLLYGPPLDFAHVFSCVRQGDFHFLISSAALPCTSCVSRVIPQSIYYVCVANLRTCLCAATGVRAG